LKRNTVELGYKVRKELNICVVITEEYNVMVSCEELIGTTEYMTL